MNKYNKSRRRNFINVIEKISKSATYWFLSPLLSKSNTFKLLLNVESKGHFQYSITEILSEVGVWILGKNLKNYHGFPDFYVNFWVLWKFVWSVALLQNDKIQLISWTEFQIGFPKFMQGYYNLR